MGKQITTEYKAPAFARGTLPEHKLSVLIGVDSLCFQITGTDGACLFLKEYEVDPGNRVQDVFDIFKEDPLLEKPGYAATHIGLFYEPAAPAPARLFDPGNAAAYWQSLSTLPAGSSTLFDALPTLDAYIVYPVDSQLAGGLTGLHPGARILHGAGVWLDGLYRHALPGEGPAMFAHLSGGQVTVAAFEGRNLRFFNTFSYHNSRDFLYYILLALDQAQLPLEETPLAISGKLTAEAEIFLLLQRYFVSLHFLSPDSAGPYPEGIPGNRRHWHFDLQCMRFL